MDMREGRFGRYIRIGMGDVKDEFCRSISGYNS